MWLVNTGWTGGPFGEGHRMPIQATRALLARRAVRERSTTAEYRTDEVFGFDVPVAVPGVDASLLDPRSTWSDPEAYDAKARELAAMFRANFEEKFAADAGEPSPALGRGAAVRIEVFPGARRACAARHRVVSVAMELPTTSSSSAPGAPACAQPSRRTTGARRSP